jgi:Ca2+/H+ antiporter, TMEM165/GDT1 family
MPAAFLVSTAVVAIAEIGDKTQLLSLVLATRFRKPVPIIIGILIATLANHALAAWLGTWMRGLVSPDTLRWVLGLSLLAIAAWALVPDKLEGEVGRSRWGVFALTLGTFFIAEIGDKTQFATIALAAQYDALFYVVVGTTLGMMLANVPAVLLGAKLSDRLPLRAIRCGAAALFAVLGVLALAGVVL